MENQPLLYAENNAQPTAHSEAKPALKKSLGRQRLSPSLSNCLPVSALKRWETGWLLDCELRRHSPETGKLRRMILKNLLWLAVREGWMEIGTTEIRAFLLYLSCGHADPGGRWGNPQMTRPVRPITVHTYHGHLKTFFSWLVTEGVLSANPMATIRPPIARADQVQPFTAAQVEALLAATNKGWKPARDAAIIWLLLDTGLRAGELCGLRFCDLDLAEKRVTIIRGKGDKSRVVYFGLHTAKALWRYLHSIDRRAGEECAIVDTMTDDTKALFFSETGVRRGEALQVNGLRQIIERLAARAELSGVRDTTHTMRHTFSVMFLRSGGQQFSLKEILGHTSLQMTTKYVQFAEADLASQRRYSPADRIKGKITQLGRPANTPKLKNVKTPCQEHSVRRKLSATDAKEIKTAALAGEPRKAIAARFGVSVSTVKQIKSGDIWKELD